MAKLFWRNNRPHSAVALVESGKSLPISCSRNCESRGEEMTGSKHNQEGNSSDRGEPDPGPYWRRMHRDWRFWAGAIFMFAALAIYVLSGDLAWVPRGQPRH
jgi:hypothetical protein